MFGITFPSSKIQYHPADIGFMRNIINDTWFLDRAHVTDDYDKSLGLLSKHIDIKVEEHPSGKHYGMWIIPPKWTVKKGTLKDSQGRVLADYHRHPLELWIYSDSFKGAVSKEELLKHLWTLPKRPDAIPSYPKLQYRHWEKDWGFCLPYNVCQSLTDGNYEVEIETEFSKSTMKTVNCHAKGSSDRMIVLSGHWDHPAQCNDGLVGCVVALDTIRRLRKHNNLRYNYHAILTVEFIGSAAWLVDNEPLIGKIREGLFVAMMGSDTDFALQRSFRGNSELERIVSLFLKQSGKPFREGPFNSIVGNDEKAFDAPGINIPMASISRWPYPEYHTNQDNPDMLQDHRMTEGSDLVYEAIMALENNFYPKALFKGLPCLSRPDINLYLSPQSLSQIDISEQAKMDRDRFGNLPETCKTDLNFFMNNVIHYMDGRSSILDIAEKFELPFFFVWNYLKAWEEKGLIRAESEPAME